MSMNSNSSAPMYYAHPFSKAYWKQAASEFKKTKVLVFAALMIALRVVMKMISIPIGPEMRINSAFIVNAFGASVFGPVVAIVAAAVSDVIGFIVFPTGGVYFVPFIFVEIAGSLFYALCFYRAKLSVGRIIVAGFLVDFGVNIIINTPVMMLYYDMIMGKYYAPLDMLRIVKNLAEIPMETIVLTFMFRALVPVAKSMHIATCDVENLRFRKKNMIALVLLVIIGAGAIFGYSVWNYNVTSLSASYSADERLEKNRSMIPAVVENNPSLADQTVVTVIESAYPKFADPNVTYSVAVYTVNEAELEANIAEAQVDDPASTYGLDTLHGYSKSKAKKDDALTSVGYATIVLDKKSGAVVSYADDFE